MERYICIHGHFYQPPRENPWLEEVELQDSADPCHDWNERITRECYAPNTAARILDTDGRIAQIISNYAHISYNFGPTLLSWLETNEPEIYQAIVTADRASQERFGGHGSAMAQVHNHMIMPLANPRDKLTQVIWGIADFTRRFGRAPAGMWLPETAVDLETLEVLASQGIRFTVLSPHQARQVRQIGTEAWQDVTGARIDPSRAYQVRLPSGRTLALFFYDGPISQAVAFEGLLANGERFAQRLLSGFNDQRSWPQLMHIATDGETYGHHSRAGEKGLAYALHHIQSQGLAKITNYGQFLALFPPDHEVEIYAPTAWSCAHGVGRWYRHCGCSAGGHGGWNQEWRTPLRNALDWLRDAIAPRFAELAGRFLRDPWAARNDYVQVVLDRSEPARQSFLQKHAVRPLQPAEAVTVWKLLEMQRHAMLMYTSCGWFFDELSGIETVQVIQYAARAVQLAEDLFATEWEPEFLSRLAAARSNIPDHGDGAEVYRRFVKPAMLDLLKVGAHYALSTPFEAYPDHTRIFSYFANRLDEHHLTAGRMRLAIGQVEVVSEITQESAHITYGVLHMGDHDLRGGVRHARSDGAYQGMVDQVSQAFQRADYSGVLQHIEHFFEGATYSLRGLFRDEQRKILDLILGSVRAEAVKMYRDLRERHAPLARFFHDLRVPVPAVLQPAAGFALSADLRRAILEPELNTGYIRDLLAEARIWGVQLEEQRLSFALEDTLLKLAQALRAEPGDQERLKQLNEAVRLAREVPFPVDLWTVQNVYFQLRQAELPRVRRRAQAGDAEAARWVEMFRALRAPLYIRGDG